MNRSTRLPLWIVMVGLVLLAGCKATPQTPDTDPPPTTLPTASGLVGTWRLVTMSEGEKVRAVSNPFFVRFYSDGTCASWPTPVAPISRGLYTVTDGQLTLPDAPHSDAVQLRLTDSKMWYWSDRVGCVYHRVTPDLEPGRLP